MRIYILQNGQPAGPLTREEIQDKIYSGGLTREAQGCLEGTQAWLPLGQLLDNAPPGAGLAAAAPPVVLQDLERLRDPKEKTALALLYLASAPVWILLLALVAGTFGLFLIYILLGWLMKAIGQAWFSAHLRTHAVRATETQLPELYRAAQAGAHKLGMACPEVYVLQQNIWNAYAAKLFKRRVIVLLSGAVDSVLAKGDVEQLTWVIGHELGHHWAGHLDARQKLASLGGWLIWGYFWHSRRRELTCDRVGLYCVGRLRPCQLALANLTVGGQLAATVDANAIAAQWQACRQEFFVKYVTLYSTYPPLLARMDHLNQAAREFGIPG